MVDGGCDDSYSAIHPSNVAMFMKKDWPAVPKRQEVPCVCKSGIQKLAESNTSFVGA